MLLPAKYGSAVARLAFLALGALISASLWTHFELATPDDHPYGGPSHIGKQAFAPSFKAGQASSTFSNTSALSAALDEYLEEDADWWVGTPEKQSRWDPLGAEKTPLTEITLKSCVLPPGLYDLCSPTSSKKEDALRGQWKRVDRDLNRKIGIYYLYIYYRRLLPGSDADVITNLTILNHAPTSDDLTSGGTWVEVSESIRTGVWPSTSAAFLHYKLTPQADVSAARKMADSTHAGDLEPITELDVVYGGEEVNPLPGYKKVSHMITGGEDDDKAFWKVGKLKDARIGAALAYRKQLKELPATPSLRFNARGNFTILQVADLHFSVGPGDCRDVAWSKRTECVKTGADRYTIAWLEKALETVKPDFVVLTGDQINGQSTSWSSQSAIMKWAPLLYERNIPWTTIFGNHDEQDTDLTSDGQIRLMQHLPLYLGESGPKSVDGHGNYVRSIRANDSDTVLTTLYFLDSHANAKKLAPWSKPGYDWIKANQINWFRGRSSQVKTYERPYQPKSSDSSAWSNRPTGHRRPNRPAAPVAAAADDDDDDDLKRRRRRQLGAGFEADDVVQDEQTLDSGRLSADKQGELGADRQAADGGWGDLEDAGTVGTGMMPSDGSQIKDADEKDVSFESDADAKADADKMREEVPNGEDEPESEDKNVNELLAADDYSRTPTDLPDGPTKERPFEAKPNALMFFHIPLQESYNALIDVGKDGKPLIIGDRYETWGASKTNSGMFEQGIAAQKEKVDLKGDAPEDPFWDGENMVPTVGRPEVKVVANGHCHNSEDCRRIKGTWLCFAGGSSYAGYGKSDFLRRLRVFSLADYGETIETWHLLDTLERVDRIRLTGPGARGD